MFGRNKRRRENVSNNRMWRNRRRSFRTPPPHEENNEAFSDFLHAVGNIARGQAYYYADHYKNMAAEVVDNFAGSLRDTGGYQGRDDGPATFVDDIADDLEELSDAIRDMKLSSALEEIEYLVKRKPVLFGLGALTAGYLVTRAVKRKGSDEQDLRPERKA
ncbi:hypothetical protein WJT86_07395 [Microvirga sp. W0021]|uniref:Uncharacterized protein n=1 Tax=Hohaiivirga grylli TaxID=3133970 RepID=A0ABV0BKR1_9HYPH